MSRPYLLLAYLLLLLLVVAPARTQPSSGGSASQKQVQYLSGRDNTRTATWDFYCTGGRKSGYWTTIQVPSCWEQQGVGAYNYGRDYKTYGKNFRFADEQSQYKHSFSVPASWQQQAVYIVFEGAMTDTEVRVNGQLAGPAPRRVLPVYLRRQPAAEVRPVQSAGSDREQDVGRCLGKQRRAAG